MIQPPAVQQNLVSTPARTASLAAPDVSRPVAVIEQSGTGASARKYQRNTETQTNSRGRHGSGHQTGHTTSGSARNGQRLSRALSRLGQLIDVYV